MGSRARLQQLKLPALTVGLSAVPLLYYAALGRADISWRLAREASKHAFSLWAILLALVPLLIGAAFAVRRRNANFLAVATRTWPLAALLIFVVSASGFSATPLHAFQGLRSRCRCSRWRACSASGGAVCPGSGG